MAAAHVWGMFLELDVTRTSSGFGLNPLPFSEFAAYERMTRTRLTLAEVALLRVLDMERITFFGKMAKAGTKKDDNRGATHVPPLPPDTGV